MVSSNNIIPASLAIKSMRDNGYKTAAHALAELIDNSIQADATNVQLICVDEIPETGKRKVPQLKKIAILDNGKGMSPKLLREALQFGGSSHRDDPNGIGKFGMGLPNASISQCKRVDVWSWKSKKEVNWTYLDVDQIVAGKIELVPEPINKEIPLNLIEMFDNGIPSSGTLIVWSKLDRVNWKTSKSIYTHSQYLVGRMYRKFIDSQKVKINFKSFESTYRDTPRMSESFKANDPLYLMNLTSLPGGIEGWNDEPIFKQMGDESEKIDIKLGDGRKSTVEIKYSYVNKDAHQAMRDTVGGGSAGSTKWGKHAADNIGVSVVRAGRELELVKIFTNDKPQERWWGVEISFHPELDEFFGVTNNKQHAVNFEHIDLKTEAELNGYEDVEEFITVFKNEDPNRYFMYTIINKIKYNISKLRKKLPEDKPRSKRDNNNGAFQASQGEIKVDGLIRERQSEGYKSSNEITYEKTKSEIKIKDLVEEFEKSNIPKVHAKEMANSIVSNNRKTKFIESSIDSELFFSLKEQAGVTIITLNKDHSFYSFFERLDEDNAEIMKVVLFSWARAEIEAMDKVKKGMRKARSDWSEMLEEFLEDFKTN
ncbi:ATP-binding protein [Vibrio breoganii]